MALPGGPLEEIERLAELGLHADALAVHQPQIVQRRWLASAGHLLDLRQMFLDELFGSGEIRLGALAERLDVGQPQRRERMAGVAGLLEASSSLDGVEL